MDYKKAYEEALERAKQGLPIDEVFPELKDSEDERIRKEMVDYFSQFKDDGLRGVDITPWIAYLEKQKEQKPESGNSEKPNNHAEWSEEDEAMLESIIKDYDYLCETWLSDYEKRVGATDPEARRDTREQISWLKSLRPQPHWKPSEEQMEVLWCATEKYLESDNEKVREIKGKVLESLYNDIKKL